MRVHRAYYHCAACGTGQIPYDLESGLGSGGLSNYLAAVVSLLAAHSSFDQAGQLVHELTGIRVDDNAIERTAQQVGEVVMAREDTAVTEAVEGRTPPAAEAQPARLYVSADGTTAPTLEGWREVKCGAIYWEHPTEGHQCQYLGRIEGCEDFGRRLWYEACRWGFRQAPEVIVLGDGAPWIWNQARVRLSRAKQILDWYHASEHVWACANALYGEGTTAAKEWAESMEGVLYEKGGRELLNRLRRSYRSRRDPPEDLEKLIGYVVENVDRMDYPSYRAAGLSIGSGPVESACKRLVNGRLKGPGMRWNRTGADAILALRITWFNGRWQELWDSKPLAA